MRSSFSDRTVTPRRGARVAVAAVASESGASRLRPPERRQMSSCGRAASALLGDDRPSALDSQQVRDGASRASCLRRRPARSPRQKAARPRRPGGPRPERWPGNGNRDLSFPLVSLPSSTNRRPSDATTGAATGTNPSVSSHVTNRAASSRREKRCGRDDHFPTKGRPPASTHAMTLRPLITRRLQRTTSRSQYLSSTSATHVAAAAPSRNPKRLVSSWPASADSQSISTAGRSSTREVNHARFLVASRRGARDRPGRMCVAH